MAHRTSYYWRMKTGHSYTGCFGPETTQETPKTGHPVAGHGQGHVQVRRRRAEGRRDLLQRRDERPSDGVGQ